MGTNEFNGDLDSSYRLMTKIFCLNNFSYPENRLLIYEAKIYPKFLKYVWPFRDFMY